MHRNRVVLIRHWDQYRSRGDLHPLKLLKVFLNFFLSSRCVSAAGRLLGEVLRAGASQAFSDEA